MNIFLPDDYILMKGNIRKKQKTIFELSRAVETQKFNFSLFWDINIWPRVSSIVRIFEKNIMLF